MKVFLSFSTAVVFLGILNDVAVSVTPTAEILLKRYDTYVYAAPGSGSGDIVESFWYASSYKLIEPINDATGCGEIVVGVENENINRFYLLLSRGNCTFTEKQVAAYNFGANGVVIYNSLEGIYQGNNYAADTEYECDNGSGYVTDIIYPVYSDEMNNLMPDSCTQNSKCSSGRCVLTNETDSVNGRKVCCAWDLYITMGADADELGSAATIPSVFITMGDYDTLASNPDLASNTLEVYLFQRDTGWNVSGIVAFLIAVSTILAAGCIVGRDDFKELSHRRYLESAPATPKQPASPSFSEQDRLLASVAPPALASTPVARPFTSDASTPAGRKAEKRAKESEIQLTPVHAVLFVLLCACALLLMYFFDLLQAVTLFYVLFGAFAVGQVVVSPFLRGISKFIAAIQSGIAAPNEKRTCIVLDDTSSKTGIASTLVGLSVSCTWYANMYADWAWVLQDAMGVCVCILCLSVIKLPNLQVATYLLLAALLYDVFFVFLSGYVFSSSVMEEVAVGSVETITDENYCEKYPDDATYCQTSSLPMLLLVPAMGTYEDGYTLLGLGDIILPGLLVVWAARHDMLLYNALDTEWTRGYFPSAVGAYALGLLLADIAVYVFETGQPAMLYIVPCMLAVILRRAYKNGALYDLWRDLPEMNVLARPESLLERVGIVRAEANWDDKGYESLERLEAVGSQDSAESPVYQSII